VRATKALLAVAAVAAVDSACVNTVLCNYCTQYLWYPLHACMYVSRYV